MSKNKFFTTRKMVTLAILSALATPLMFIEIAPVPLAPWLKFDFSDVVVLISAVIYGPIGAIIVAFIKALINFIVKGSEVGIPINQIIAFVASLAYAIPFYYIIILVKKLNKVNTKTAKALTFIFGTILIFISFVCIEYLLTPAFTSLFHLAEPVNRLNWILTYLDSINIVGAIGIMTLLMKKVNDDRYFLIRFVPVALGTVSLTILLTFLNYIWFTPLYLDLYGWDLPQPFFKWVVEIYAPFNFVKGTLLSIAFVLLSYRLVEVTKFIKGEDEKENLLDIHTQR